MKLKKGIKKINIVRGCGIASDLDLLRKEINLSNIFNTLIETDMFIVKTIRKMIK